MKRQKEDENDPITHDAYFRKSFSDVRLARNYLESFLPDQLLAPIDLNSLEQDETSYVDAKYQKLHADVVYQAKFKDNELPLTISFLFEHKSRQPANIYLQLLSYILQVWERCVQDKRPLSFVLPIVVYHGRRAWRMRQLSFYFKGLPPDFERFLPSFNYHLTDLASTPTAVLAQLQNRYFLQHVLAALKFAGQNKASDDEFLLLLVQGDNERALRRLGQTLAYLLANLPATELNRLELLIQQKQPKMTTIYQALVDKGREEGRAEGRAEGQELAIKVFNQIQKFPNKSDAEIASQLKCDQALVSKLRKLM